VSEENSAPPEAAIDGQAEEISSEPRPLPLHAHALALAPRPPAEREVLMPLDPERVVEGMRRYQQLLRDLLDQSDWQTEDKNGNPLERPFLKKSGWRKIARAFNLSFERVHSRVERDEDGTPARAEVFGEPQHDVAVVGLHGRSSLRDEVVGRLVEMASGHAEGPSGYVPVGVVGVQVDASPHGARVVRQLVGAGLPHRADLLLCHRSSCLVSLVR
jgi:hypothetical protein